MDPGRALGSDQADAIRSHILTGSTNAAGAHTPTAYADNQGKHIHNIHHGNLTPDGADFGTPGEPRNPLNGTDAPYLVTTTTESGEHTHNITVNPVPDHVHPFTVSYVGAAETRVQSIAFLACIKY